MHLRPMLPLPRARLADCCWLPRLIAKARQLESGELPAEYAARFCDRDSVDAHFLETLGLRREDLLQAVRQHPDEAGMEAWFRAQPGIDAERIARWNTLAENLGRPGFPMAERFADVLPTMYRHLDPAKVQTIFDLLEADETGSGRT